MTKEQDNGLATPHRYSYSQIQMFASCGLKYRMRYIDHLMPLEGIAEHDLRFGHAGHAALAVLYSPSGTVKLAQEAFADAYPESEYPLVLPQWSQGKSFSGGLQALAQYAQHHRDEDANHEVLEVEQITVENGDESRLVRLDLITRDRRDGLVYGWDHKFTGKYLDSHYWLQFDPHSQIRQYVDSLQKRYGRENVGGFYINALGLKHRSKAYTPRKGPDKGVQLPAGDWADFKRMVFNPNTEAVQAERANFSAWVGRIEHAGETGEWPYNTDQCVKGPIVCEYHKICSAGWSWPRDEELITAHYRQQCPKLVNGERCQLNDRHDGEHDATRPVRLDYEIDLGEEIEEGVDA